MGLPLVSSKRMVACTKSFSNDGSTPPVKSGSATTTPLILLLAALRLSISMVALGTITVGLLLTGKISIKKTELTDDTPCAKAWVSLAEKSPSLTT